MNACTTISRGSPVEHGTCDVRLRLLGLLVHFLAEGNRILHGGGFTGLGESASSGVGVVFRFLIGFGAMCSPSVECDSDDRNHLMSTVPPKAGAERGQIDRIPTGPKKRADAS